MVKSSTRTAMKKANAAIASGDKTAATEACKQAIKAIDKAASKGVYHKNNAARKKSQLTRLVNQV
jgi:small subunit ribosomal protein S20